MIVKIKGDIVKELIFKKNWTLREAAKKFGVCYAYLWLLLAEKENPGPRVRRKMLEALEINDFDKIFFIPKNEDGSFKYNDFGKKGGSV